MTEPLRIVLATGNQGKVKEIKHILGSVQVEFKTLLDFPDVVPAEETGSTFEDNALAKALHVWRETGLASLADDSGLEVDALGGEPGVRSARFAGEDGSYAANNEKLIRVLSDVPKDERTARFVCVAVLVTPAGKMVLQRGEMEGLIVDEPRGSGGFGYDPIFYVPHLKKTVAELDEAEKNSISHRAKAFGAMKSFIAAL
ncbi:MAG: XTP/dITP diphosphatase [Candidatus Eisenbacteria bacterium]